MFHICDVNSNYSPTGGGIRTYHHQKMAYFRKQKDIRYTLIVPSDRGTVEREGNVTKIGVRGLPIPGAWNYRFFIALPSLRRHLENLSPDVIEVGSPYLEPLLIPLIASGLQAAFVGFWHTHYPAAYVERALARIHPVLGRVGKETAWWWARHTYGRLDASFAAAFCIAEELKERGIRKVYHTPLGVDTLQYHPGRCDESLRRRAGAVDGKPLLFFPHRLLEEKGLSTLLRAFPAIHRETGAVVVFAGQGQGESRLRQFAAAQNGVLFLDHIPDPELLSRWYASADAVFALSAFETFGLSAAEGMASGCAIIGSEEAGIGELVRKSGCGVTVPFGDSGILAETTIRFLGSGKLREAGRAARSYAEQFFNWDRVFERQLEYYVRISRDRLPIRNVVRMSGTAPSVTESG